YPATSRISSSSTAIHLRSRRRSCLTCRWSRRWSAAAGRTIRRPGNAWSCGRPAGVAQVRMAPFRVVLLPGSVLPAEPAYAGLIEGLGVDADAVARDLEVYATDRPPEGYSLDHEIDGVLRELDERGWERAHM